MPMGRVLKDATVKVGGQGGPLSKGVPLIKAVGPGGLVGLAHGKRVQPNMQVPGFKSLIQRGIDGKKLKKPPGWPKA